MSDEGARHITDEGAAALRCFPDLRTALTALPELLRSCSLEGISGDGLAALLTSWGLEELAYVEIGDESYEWDRGVLCPTDYGRRRDDETVVSRSFARYGGDFGPCSTLDCVQINGSAASGSSSGSSEGRRRSAGSLIRARGSPPASPRSRRSPDDRGAVVPGIDDEEDADSLVPSSLRWSERSSHYELLRGQVFDDGVRWREAEGHGPEHDRRWRELERRVLPPAPRGARSGRTAFAVADTVELAVDVGHRHRRRAGERPPLPARRRRVPGRSPVLRRRRARAGRR